MLVVDSAKKIGRGTYELPIDKEINLLIKNLLEREPVVEIEVKAGEPIPVKHKLRAAEIHNSILKKAKVKSLAAAREIEKLKQPVPLEEKRKTVVKLKVLKKELEKLRELLDKYEKICRGKVVFVRGDVLKKVVPNREAVSVLMSPDIMQFVMQFLMS